MHCSGSLGRDHAYYADVPVTEQPLPLSLWATMAKKSNSSSGKKEVYKSAKTGKFVSKAAAKRWPNRTYKQTVEADGKN